MGSWESPSRLDGRSSEKTEIKANFFSSPHDKLKLILA